MIKKETVNRFSDARGFVFEPLDGELLFSQKNTHVVVSRPGPSEEITITSGERKRSWSADRPGKDPERQRDKRLAHPRRYDLPVDYPARDFPCHPEYR